MTQRDKRCKNLRHCPPERNPHRNLCSGQQMKLNRNHLNTSNIPKMTTLQNDQKSMVQLVLKARWLRSICQQDTTNNLLNPRKLGKNLLGNWHMPKIPRRLRRPQLGSLSNLSPRHRLWISRTYQHCIINTLPFQMTTDKLLLHTMCTQRRPRPRTCPTNSWNTWTMRQRLQCPKKFLMDNSNKLISRH